MQWKQVQPRATNILGGMLLGMPTFQVRNSGHCSSLLPVVFPFLPFSSSPAKHREVSFLREVRGKARPYRYFCDILSPGNVPCDNYGRFMLTKMLKFRCVKITRAHVVVARLPVLVEPNIYFSGMSVLTLALRARLCCLLVSY